MKCYMTKWDLHEHHIIHNPNQGKVNNLKMLNALNNGIDSIPTPQAKISWDLIISTPSCMKFLCGFTDQIRKCCFNVHVHILSVCPPNKLASFNLSLNLTQAFENTILIAVANQSLRQTIKSTNMQTLRQSCLIDWSRTIKIRYLKLHCKKM